MYNYCLLCDNAMLFFCVDFVQSTEYLILYLTRGGEDNCSITCNKKILSTDRDGNREAKNYLATP